jgi:hypothetical protein
MAFPLIGAHEVKSSVPALKAVFDERAKRSVLLVHAVEKSANVTLLTENAAGTLHGTAVRFHISPPTAHYRPKTSQPQACVRAARMQTSKSSSSKGLLR